MKIDLKAKPFFLGDDDIKWVEDTLDRMSLEEKIGQIFVLTGMSLDAAELAEIAETWKPGGYMFRAGPAAEVQAAVRALQEKSEIPLIIASNLESGGNGIAADGTFFGKAMLTAATGDTDFAKKMGIVCGKEGAAVGCNLTFSPVVDLDLNWRNPITNVRCFGSDVKAVLEMSAAFVEGLSGTGLSPTIKHFPGDGVDERDQHLLPTVNSLSAEDWEKSYGSIFRKLIDDGAPAVMTGHILQPELTRKMNPAIRDEDIFPASTSRELLTDLLRGDMGFNGLILTDATAMVGFSVHMGRQKALVQALAAGCDMLLFCKNTAEDFAAIRNGIESGALPQERLNEAVCRVLAFKAMQKLHEKKRAGTLVPDPSALEVVGCARHQSWAADCANQGITLVKDTQNLLPISPGKLKRVRLTVLGERDSGGFGDNGSIAEAFKSALERAGFEVSCYDYQTLEHGEVFHCGVEDMKAKIDLSIVAANVANASNYTTRRLDWVNLMAADSPWYVRDIPTLFVSFANPYHLVDVPFIQTFINCYTSNEHCVTACVEKLIGKSGFWGKSPVDPFCNMWGADR